MELFKLFGTIAIDNSGANKGIDETTDKAERSHPKISAAFAKIGEAAINVGKVVATGMAAGAAAIGALAKEAIEAYADYEQLVGGIETLFKESSDKVMEYANQAYKTAGLSANEYMETVTSFSASLLQGLGGDTELAAEIANRAITDMSDNANKMGTDMSMIQNAYQGFAKQNYTMLDNLKLGYGGTQAEMARLINDSGVLGDTIEVTAETVNSVSFDKIIEAISVVQTRMGITGTTAKEASSTIQGSLSSMKASWKNLLVGMADDQADLEQLIDEFVESAGTAAENIIPRIEIALVGAAKLIDKLFPVILNRLPQLIHDILPQTVQSAVSIVQSLVNGLQENKETIFATATDLFSGTILPAIANMIPQIISLGADLVVSFAESITEPGTLKNLLNAALEIVLSIANGISTSLSALADAAVKVIVEIARTLTEPGTLESLLDAALGIVLSIVDGITKNLSALTDAAISVIWKLVDVLTDPDTLENVLDSALGIILALAEGLSTFLPELVEAAAEIIIGLAEFLLDPENMQKILDTAIELIKALADGLVSSIPSLVGAAISLTESFIETIFTTDWIQVGADIVSGIIEGFDRAWDNVVAEYPIADTILDKVTDMVGHSYSGIGLDDLFTWPGWDGNFSSDAQSQWADKAGLPSHADGLDYVPYDGYIAELHKGEMVIPEATSRRIRAGMVASDSGEVVSLLERILYALEENGQAKTSIMLNNREFARLVKAVN